MRENGERVDQIEQAVSEIQWWFKIVVVNSIIRPASSREQNQWFANVASKKPRSVRHVLHNPPGSTGEIQHASEFTDPLSTMTAGSEIQHRKHLKSAPLIFPIVFVATCVSNILDGWGRHL